MNYSYDRRASKDVLVPVRPGDNFREIARRMVLHAAANEIVKLSPRSSPKHDDFVFWYDEGRGAFQAVLGGRPIADLNGKFLALKVVEAWAEDPR